jgi:hypothetical protein
MEVEYNSFGAVVMMPPARTSKTAAPTARRSRHFRHSAGTKKAIKKIAVKNNRAVDNQADRARESSIETSKLTSANELANFHLLLPFNKVYNTKGKSSTCADPNRVRFPMNPYGGRLPPGRKENARFKYCRIPTAL